MQGMIGKLCAFALSALFLAAAGPAAAETLSGKALVDALRGGGHTIYFRHAATDWNLDDHVAQDGDWKSCAPDRMRQLSDAGRDTAKRIGAAMRALKIPVAKVISSEYCRAVETARLLGLGPVETTRDIMNLRSSAYVGGDAKAAENARRVMAEAPSAAGNAVVAGHGNLIRAATGIYPGEGGAVVFRPDAKSANGLALVAEISPEDWGDLAARYAAD
jgi:broad specificity phosphatase PhoE